MGTGCVNSFLWKSGTDDEHYRKRSWGYSLAHMFDHSKYDFTAEVIYEVWVSLEHMVSMIPHGKV